MKVQEMAQSDKKIYLSHCWGGSNIYICHTIFFYWPTSTVFLINSCFSSSSINKQKFWGGHHHVCDFLKPLKIFIVVYAKIWACHCVLNGQFLWVQWSTCFFIDSWLSRWSCLLHTNVCNISKSWNSELTYLQRASLFSKSDRFPNFWKGSKKPKGIPLDIFKSLSTSHFTNAIFFLDISQGHTYTI